MLNGERGINATIHRHRIRHESRVARTGQAVGLGGAGMADPVNRERQTGNMSAAKKKN
jgi:hypothetical protein